MLNPNLRLEEYDLNTYKITNVRQNIYTLIDKDDIYIFDSGLYFYYNTAGYFITDNYNGEKAYLHRIVMKKSLDAYYSAFGNTNVVVDHRNRIRWDNRKSNLFLVSRRFNKLNSNLCLGKELIGIMISRNGTWLMQIKNPYDKLYVKKYYDDKYQAALSYDYLALRFYPWDLNCTNYERGNYPQSVLDTYNIKCKEDIPFFEGNEGNHLGFGENQFWGITEDVDKRGTYNVRLVDENGDRIFLPGMEKVPKDKIIEAVIARECYMLDHPGCRSKSNAIYPQMSEGENKKIVAGIIVTKDEAMRLHKKRHH